MFDRKRLYSQLVCHSKRVERQIIESFHRRLCDECDRSPNVQPVQHSDRRYVTFLRHDQLRGVRQVVPSSLGSSGGHERTAQRNGLFLKQKEYEPLKACVEPPLPHHGPRRRSVYPGSPNMGRLQTHSAGIPARPAELPHRFPAGASV